MKNLLLTAIAMLCILIASAQTPPFYNSNAYGANNSFPLSSTSSNKVQWITGPNQFATGGTGVGTNAYQGFIDTIWLKAGSTVGAPGPGPYSGFSVSFAQNQGTATTWTGTTFVPSSSLTVAHAPTGTQSLGATTAGQWYPIALTTPYLYNPALSLVIEVKQNGYSSGVTTSQSGAIGARRWGGYTSSTGSSGSSMANMGFSLASNLSCATPSNGSATNIRTDSITIGWTDNNSPAATTWQIEYGLQGFTPTGIPQITSASNPQGIGGLTQSTAYDFYVRSYCGANDSSYYHPIYNITTQVSCAAPSNLSASNITSSSAQLNWIENGSSTSWNIEFGTTGFTPTGNASFTVTSKPFTLPGLPQNTCFDYYVQADCGVDSSLYTGPFTFCTAAAPLNCPSPSSPNIILSENFLYTPTTSGDTLPSGWTRAATYAGNRRWLMESNATASANTGPSAGNPPGSGYVYFESDVNSPFTTDTLISPFIDLSGTVSAARVKFFYHMFGATTGGLELIADNGTTETVIWSKTGQQQSSSAATWDSAVVSLNAYINQSIHLRFVATASGTTSDIALDDVSIEGCIACPQPTNITAANISSTQADIGWTENGTATTWNLEVVPTGTNPTGTPTHTTASNPYTLTGLTQNQEVDIYVRAVCGGANGNSNYTGPYTLKPCNYFSGTYTINPSLPASGTNFQSFTAFATAVQICGLIAPTVVQVDSASGPYNEQFILPEIPGASTTNTLTFEGNGATIFDTATVSSARHTIRLDGADHIHFKNLTVENRGTAYGFAMHLYSWSGNGCNDNKFTNCEFKVPVVATSSAFCPFACSGSLTSATSQQGGESDDNVIDSCKTVGGYYGITMYGQSTGTCNGNKVLNTEISDYYYYGFYHLYQNFFEMRNCEFHKPTRTTHTTNYCIYGSGTGSSNVYDGNHMHDLYATNTASTSTCYGIYNLMDASSPATSNVYSNNLIESMYSRGTIYGFYFSTAHRTKVLHNTIVLDADTVTTNSVRAIYITGTSSLDNVVQNNNIMVDREGGTNYGLYLNVTNIVSDYNNVYMIGNGTNHYGYKSGVRSNLAAWQTAGVGANSLDENPVFVNPATADYHPQNFTMNDVGTPVGVLTDFEGATRSTTTPDMGAFEFSVACPNPSNMTASNITNNSADISWTENGTATIWEMEIVPSGSTPTGTPDSTGITNNTNFTINGLTQYQAVDIYVRAVCGGANGNSIYDGPLTVLPCAPLSGSYTINQLAAASATNFQSFNDAAFALQCGVSAPVVFNVTNTAPVAYNEQVIFTEVMGASATNTITFNGNNATISLATTTSTDRHIIRLDGADYFRFNNLNISSAATSNVFAVHLFNGSASNGTNHNRFKNCDISVVTSATVSSVVPFAMSGSLTSATTACAVEADSNIIDSCTMTGGYYGVTMYGITLGLANGNQIKNSNITDFYYYGIYTLYQNNFLVSKNNISRPTRTTFTTGYGIYASGTASNGLYEKNWIHNVFGTDPSSTSAFYGMYFLADAIDTANANVIQNNLVEDIEGSGTHYCLYTSTANNLKVYHNTFVEDFAGATGGTTRGIYQAGSGSQGNIFLNNNIVISRGGTSTKHGIYLLSASTICDYNNVHIGSVTGTNYYGYYSGNRADLTAWQAASPTLGQNSTDANPSFANPSPDYTPGSSLMNNTGTSLGIVDDYLDSLRSSTAPDVGAFEFSVPCFAPSNLTASNVTGTSAQISWTENGSATLWDIEIVPSGTTPTGIPDSTGVTNNTNFQLNGLTQYQAIDVYVRADCGSGTGTSAYYGPLTILPCAPLAGTYTINQLAGPSATNFQSFSDVAFALQCGISAPVVFNVNNTLLPYSEQVVFMEVDGASATNTITFNGNGATISSTTTTTDRHIIRLDGSDYFRFNDLTVSALSNAEAMPMHLLNTTNGTNNNIFKRCTFEVPTAATVSTTSAFAMSGSTTSATTACQVEADSNIIDSCTMTGGYYGVTMYGKTTGEANGNQILNSNITDFYYYGAYIYYQDDMLISGNDISRPTRTALTTAYCMYINGTGENGIFEKNRIHNLFGTDAASTSAFYGIYITTDASSVATSNVIRNNLFEDLEGNGTHYAIYPSTANNLKIYHNTIIEDYAAATGGTNRGIYQLGTTAVGQDIQNNLIYFTKGGTGQKYGMYIQSTSAFYDHNNVFFGPLVQGTNYYGYAQSGTRTTLANWKAASATKGQNALDLDPTFTQPAPDYTPSNAAFNDKGNGLNVVDDYLGNNRLLLTPDIGAFEFAVAATDMAANQILSPDTSTGCYTNAETVSVQVSNAGSSAINFVTNPMTVTVKVTGATTSTLTATINTGTLASFATLTVNVAPTLNMQPNGVYTLNTYISTTGDANTINDTLPAYVFTVSTVAGTVEASPKEHCNSGTSQITVLGNQGGDIQWQKSASGSAPWTNVGTNNTTYNTDTLTTTTFYRALVSCNANVDSSNVDTVVVNNPMITSTQTDTVCGTGTATLLATSDGSTISWYDEETGGSTLDTGATFTTPILTSTDTFYVASGLGGTSVLITEICSYENSAGWTTPTPPVPSSITDPIELTNTGTSSVDLSGWKLQVTGGSAGSYVIPAGNVVAAGETFVLGRSGSSSTNTPGKYVASTLPSSSSSIASGFILSNPSGEVQDVAAINGYNVVGTGSPAATATDWSGTVPSSTSTSGIRRTVVDDNDNSSDWTVASSSNLCNYGSPNMTFTPSGGCQGSRVPVIVPVNTLPTVTATANPDTVCAGNSTTLTGGGASTYVWDNSVVDNTPFTPTATNTYTVTGTDGNGCSNTATKEVVVQSSITVTASATSDTICAGDSTTLTGGGATNYTWDNSVTDGVAFAPTTTTVYTVTGTDAGGCSNTATIEIVVNTNPTVTATANPDTVCSGNSTTLTGGGASTYTWDNNVTDNTPFTPTATNTYTVTGTDGNGCSNTATKEVVVNPGVTVTATATSDTICAGDSTALTGGGATSYTWDNGVTDGVAFAPTTTTTYTVTGTDAGGCTNTATIEVVVNTAPTVTASANPDTVCSGGSTTLTGGGASTYTWDNSVTDNTPFVPTATTTYTVTGTDANGCTNTATKEVVVQSSITVTASATNDTICTGDSTTLTGGGASSYSWTGGVTDGVAFAPTTTTTYTVTGTDAGGCSNTATIEIVVNSLPTITATATNDSVCGGGTTALTGGGATTYTWDNSVIDGVAFSPPSTTTYTVTGIDANGCSNTATKAIVVNPAPTVTASASNDTICSGASTTLTGGGASTYAWDNSVSDGVAFTPTATTTYTVTGTDATGCTNTATKEIVVNPTPAAPTVSVTQPACSTANGTITITAPVGAGFEYSIDSTNYISATSFSAQPNTYYITARNAAYPSCISAATMAVVLQDTTPCGPNVTVGASASPSSIPEAGTSSITYFVNNTGMDTTTGLVRVLIVKPVNGTLTLNLPSGWSIQSNSASSYVITTMNQIPPGLSNSVSIPGSYTHNGTNEDAVRAFDVLAEPGTGGELITDDNSIKTFVQIN